MFFIFGVQLCIFIFFVAIIVIMLFRRDLTPLSYFLMAIYAFSALAIGINILYFFLPLISQTTFYFLHFFAAFFIFYSIIFPLLFGFSLFYPGDGIKYKLIKIFAIITHAIILFIILSLPGAISVEMKDNWIPIWSWQLLGLLFIYISIILFLTLWFNIRIYKRFKDKNLKKRWSYFIIGASGLSTFLYTLTLYNTLRDEFFGTVYSVFSLLIIPFTYLIYVSIGKNL